MASFPTSVVSNTDPTSGNTLNSPDHALLHQSHNAEDVAIETKLGTGASTPVINRLLYGNGTGTSAWTQLTSAQLAASLTDETGSGVAVFGTAPTISAPVVSTGTFASPVLTTPAVVTSINDANGNEIIKTPATSSAVNEVTITNAATGNSPRIAASGGDSTAHLNLRGLGLAKTVTIGAGATVIFPYDYVVSGCIWSGDAYASTRAASMTSGVVVINGNPVTVALVTARTFTASKDTYIDVLDNGDGTGLIVYTETTNNAASAALAANSIRIGIIITGASTIAAATSVNQGQETMVLPIASSIAYSVTDSLGNLICPRDPNRKLLGFRQITADQTTAATSATQITGLSVPVIIPIGRKVKVSVISPSTYVNATVNVFISVWDGTVGSGTQLQQVTSANSAVNQQNPMTAEATTTPSATSKTYNAGWHVISGTGTTKAAATTPSVIKVELL